MRFTNREEAGQLLAEKLVPWRGQPVVVYALPRGGVVLGRVIADALGAFLDLVITRKIGHPYNPEYAICAVAEDGDLVCNEAERTAVDQEWFQGEVEKEQAEAKRRREVYLAGREPMTAKNKIAIIVDDGIATGLTMQLAIREVKHGQPARVIVAIPVVPVDTAAKLRAEVDELVALDIPEFYLGAVGAYYEEFRQVEDEEVMRLLRAKP